MATPTPSTNTPSKQVHTFSSPAPRSVPPTGGSTMLSYDSPAVLNMLHDVSAGMGGVGMGISMSGLGMSSLGLSASSMGRADEAERTRRLHSILATVAAKPGRVGEAGLLALCKRLGITYDEHAHGAGTWALLLGDEAICDVTFDRDDIVSVNLQTNLDIEKPELQFGASASRILVRSLRPLPGQSRINVTLERFAESLEKLLALDKVGAPQSRVSCYNAIAGVYTSLRTLFEHEKKTDLATRAPDDRFRALKAERHVLSKKSGRPRLNGGSCLGLSLDYWMDRRYMSPHHTPTPSDETNAYPEDDDDNTRVYSLTIECESSPATLYPPIRISDEWISSTVEKPADVNDANASIDSILLDAPSIDWLDPKPTYLDASAQADDALHLDTTAGRLPNIRFVAKFNPPLVVPLNVHVQLYQIVGVEPRTEDFRATTFVGLALRPGEIDPGITGTAGESTHEIRTSRSVLVLDNEHKHIQRAHDMSLYVPKMEYSRTLESLPFSHPKQLIEILPVLRQYAFATSLLCECFYEKGVGNGLASMPHPPSPPLTPPQHSLNDIQPPLQLDINLSYTSPTPRLSLHIPHPASTLSSHQSHKGPSLDSVSALLSTLLSATSPVRAALSVTLDVHANGDLIVSEQNLIPVPALPSSADGKDVDVDVDMEAAEQRELRVKRLAMALDVCGDLGVWGEWLRREVARGEKEKEKNA